ncbi:MAG: ADP-ribosylation factor-like protein [Candidatus Hermodarchaeota archaeon]
MSNNVERGIPDRIKSLITIDHLDKPFTEYNKEELADLPPKAIYGIGPYYATKLKRQANVKSIADLAKLDLSSDLGISPKLIEKWTIAASIIINFTLDTKVIVAPRICLAGLSAAGKSSLIQTLQKQETTPVKFPTFGLAVENLTFLGLNIVVWDLGGQVRFRNMYLSNPQQYLSETMILIYVIDSQNTALADDTAQFLDELLIKLRYLKESPKIYLTLHKYDPNLKKSTLNSSIDIILNKIDPILSRHGISKYSVLRTSIYDVEGLVYLFSRIFADVSPLSNILSDSLAFYCESHGIIASYLITDSGFITAEWTEKLSEDQREEIFLEIMESIRKEVYESEEKQKSLTFQSHINELFITLDRIKLIGAINLYFCSISRSLRTSDDLEMITLRKEIQPWIINFFSIISS